MKKSLDKIICITGFSCSGKSTIGPKLAKQMNLPFYDLDSLIVKRAGKSINEIFRENGEIYFRRLEKKLFFEICGNRFKSKIIALGGGAYENAEIRKHISKTGISVYLSCSQRELYRRIRRISDRPLMNTVSDKNRRSSEALRNKISLLMNKRIKNYKKADIIISTTNRRINDAVRLIIEKLSSHYASN